MLMLIRDGPVPFAIDRVILLLSIRTVFFAVILIIIIIILLVILAVEFEPIVVVEMRQRLDLRLVTCGAERFGDCLEGGRRC
jgi:hypothetical protein